VVLRGRVSDPAAALSGSQTKAPGFAGGYLLFRAAVSSGDNEVESMIILTNPSNEDIDDFLDLGLSEVDQAIRACWDPKSGLRRLVFEYSDKRLFLKFGVRKDAAPLYPKSAGDNETDR